MITAMLAVVPVLTSVLFMAEVKQRPSFEYRDQHIVLNADMGGDIDSYAEFFALAQKSGEPIWVMGACLSACTLVLKNPKACATPNAYFGFHSARIYSKSTLEVLGDSDNGNKLLWAHYPEKVKARLGGRLGPNFVYIKGTELLPACHEIPATKQGERYNQASKPLLPALEPTRFYGKGF
jgi:hypothetical protein